MPKVNLNELGLRNIIRSALEAQEPNAHHNVLRETREQGPMQSELPNQGQYIPLARLVGYVMAAQNPETAGMDNFWVPLTSSTTLTGFYQSLSAGKDFFKSNTDDEFGGGKGFNEADPSSMMFPALKFILLNLMLGNKVTYKTRTLNPVTIAPGKKITCAIDGAGRKGWYRGEAGPTLLVYQELGVTLTPMNDAAGIKSFISHVSQNPSFLENLINAPPAGLQFDVNSKGFIYYGPELAEEYGKKLDVIRLKINQSVEGALAQFNTAEVRETILKPLAMPGSWIAHALTDDRDSMYTSPWRQSWGLFNSLYKQSTQNNVAPQIALSAISILLEDYIATGMPDSGGTAGFDTSSALNESRRKAILTREQLTRVIRAALEIKTGNLIAEADLRGAFGRILGIGDQAVPTEPGAVSRVTSAAADAVAAQRAAATAEQAGAGDILAQVERAKARLADPASIETMELPDQAKTSLAAIKKIVTRTGEVDEYDKLAINYGEKAIEAAKNAPARVEIKDLTDNGVNPTLFTTTEQKTLTQDFLNAANDYAEQIINAIDPGSVSRDTLDRARLALENRYPSILPAIAAKGGDLVPPITRRKVSAAAKTATSASTEINKLTASALEEAFGFTTPRATSSLNILKIEGTDKGFKITSGGNEVTLDSLTQLIEQAKSTTVTPESTLANARLRSFGFEPLAGGPRSTVESADLFVSTIISSRGQFVTSVLEAGASEVTKVKLTIILQSAPSQLGTARLAQAAQTAASSGNRLFTLKNATRVLTFDGIGDSVLSNYRKYKEDLDALAARASGMSNDELKKAKKAITRNWIGREIIGTVLTGERVQADIGRIVLTGTGKIATKAGAAWGLNVEKWGATDKYWGPRALGWILTQAAWMAYDPEDDPDSYILTALYNTITSGSTIKPSGLGSSLIALTSYAIRETYDSLHDRFSDEEAKTPLEKFYKAGPDNTVTLDYLQTAVKAYSQLVTGKLSQSQFENMFPYLTSGAPQAIIGLGEVTATVTSSTEGVRGLWGAISDYIASKKSEAEAAAATGMGTSASGTSEAEQQLSSTAASIARQAAADELELATIQQLIANKTPYTGEVAKNLKALNGGIIKLVSSANSAIETAKRVLKSSAISASADMFSGLQADLGSTRQMMLMSFGREYDTEAYPTSARGVLQPDFEAFVEATGGDKNLITLGVNAAYQTIYGFSDDPVDLTGLGLATVKAHASDFGYNITSDELSPDTLELIGMAMQGAATAYNEAYNVAQNAVVQNAAAAAAGAETSAPTSRP